LHQTGFLHLLAEFYSRTLVPPAVVEELERGRAIGVDLPDVRALPWLTIQAPEGLERVPMAASIPRIEPVLALLHRLGFRLSAKTRAESSDSLANDRRAMLLRKTASGEAILMAAENNE
jgi:hypothetical protein